MCPLLASITSTQETVLTKQYTKQYQFSIVRTFSIHCNINVHQFYVKKQVQRRYILLLSDQHRLLYPKYSLHFQNACPISVNIAYCFSRQHFEPAILPHPYLTPSEAFCTTSEQDRNLFRQTDDSGSLQIKYHTEDAVERELASVAHALVCTDRPLALFSACRGFSTLVAQSWSGRRSSTGFKELFGWI